MKTTLKEYQANIKQRRDWNHEAWAINDKGSDINSDWDRYFELKGLLEELEHTFFRQLDTIKVSFYIGYRSYYREVIKIGKFYFDRGDKMTKGNGFRNVEEIPAITDKMKESMLSDSYYY